MKSKLRQFVRVEIILHIMMVLYVQGSIMMLHRNGTHNPFSDLGISLILILILLPVCCLVTGCISGCVLKKGGEVRKGFLITLLLCFTVMIVCFRGLGIYREAALTEYGILLLIYAHLLIISHFFMVLIKWLFLKCKVSLQKKGCL